MKFHLVVVFSLINLTVNAQSWKKSIKYLPDTGQTKSYTNTLGEDSDYNIHIPYYINNGNGTITDTVTGLMWQQTDGGEMTFDAAIQYVDDLVLGEHDDWRLPSAAEAYTVMHLQNNNPALDINYFTKTGAEYWWTSDKQKNDPNKIWVTNSGGGIGNHLKTETISAGGTKKYHIRAVRNIQAAEVYTERFVKVGNDIVIDQWSDLMWQVAPSTTPLDWESALSKAEASTLGGYDDWRLPNIKELHSLQDVGLIQPCVHTSYFPSIGIRKYWSSTTLANQATKAWYFDTNFGITTQDLKTNSYFTIFVRTYTEGTTSKTSETNVAHLIHIYPNPANDVLHMHVPDGICKNWKFTIYNLSGQAVFSSQEISDVNSYEFFTGFLPDGIYIMEVQSDYENHPKLLVINH